jgi:LPXTG-site transpeptidase (sortase) family protein
MLNVMAEYESEIHKLLKLGGPDNSDHSIEHVSTPEHLPVAPSHDAHAAHGAATAHSTPSIGHSASSSSVVKNIIVYPFIFLTAFVFFYVLLNFSSMWAQVEGFFSKPQAEQILGADTAPYYKWISNYFYAVGDPKLLEPTNDIDKDGLSNSDEFVMRTNPIIADSDSDGFSDGIEIINNQNPWGSGSLSDKQRKLAADLDLIMINNRVSYNVSQNQHVGSVSGAVTPNNNYNLEKPGRLSIPKLNLQVSLIWSKDPADFDADLTKGVIHYPGTALPGENGIIYVSGHSSDYIWKRNPMHNIFAKLNYLKPGDDIFIEMYGNDGKVYNYRYQVQLTHTYKADDQTQFIDTAGSKLNLSTCWPIGTQKDRLVVTAVPVAL